MIHPDNRLPELLSPAGSRKALEAAIEAGADAVYFGAGEYNARMRAENFRDEALRDALRLCRGYGVKTYVTLNTRLYDNELSGALRLAAELYEGGADALIVADCGIASLIRERIPGFELHASTQVSGHTAADAEALQTLGFSRMVCPREISGEQLSELCRRSPLEIEMFIHGAYCVSFSGQCLMSAVMGGRSGNRGECAQPCRQPYTMNGKKGYPISLKDMCLAGHVKEIILSGVSSLKIEGRQKPPEYVYGVTKIYRRLLDEGRDETEDEREALRRIFSRDGFTDGYFTGLSADMCGVRTYDDYLQMDKTPFGGLTRKVPLSVKLTVKSGSPAELFARSPYGSATVKSDAPSESTSPLNARGAYKNAARLGNTPFVLEEENFVFDADASAQLTLSGLNALRRAAVEKLLSPNGRGVAAELSFKAPAAVKPWGVIWAAQFMSQKQITPLAAESFDKIYLPFGVENSEYGVSVPPVTPDGGDRMWDKLCGRELLVHNIGQLYEARRRGISAACSLRMNVFNSEAAEIIAGLGAKYITLSPELRDGAMRDLSSPVPKAVAVYGRLPLMTTVRCAISDGGESCSRGGRGLCGRCEGKNPGEPCRSSITDRHGTVFPVFGMPDCANIIYNANVLYCADKPDSMKKTGAGVYFFIFTDETPEECDRIIRAYKTGAAPDDMSKIRRL